MSSNYRNCKTYKRLRRNHSDLNNIAFGDEGRVLACMDYGAEIREDCEDCNNYKCPYNNEDKKDWWEE